MIMYDEPHSILAAQHQAFMAHPPVHGLIDTGDGSIPGLLRHYEYPVSSWPIFIDPSAVRTLAELSTTLPRLLAQIPERYFANNMRRLADFYFQGDETLARYALHAHEKGIEIGCRLDLTLGHKGFQVLEVNIGTSIGGWQVHTFESLIRSLHAPMCDPRTSGQFESRNTQRLYISFLVDKILEYVPAAGSQANVFIELDGSADETTRKQAGIFFNDLLRRELKERGLSGGAYVGPLDLLTIGDEYEVRLNNRVIHAVLSLGTDAGRLSTLLLSSFLLNQVYFPDHPGLVLLKNKANLMLLRELAARKAFSDRENELVLRHLPWTQIIKDADVEFNGRIERLPALLRRDRAGFVIKTATGFQGREVFVGKYTPAEDWEKVVDFALDSKGFIAQQFSDSLDFLAPDRLNEWRPHKLIWGAFGFGECYGGVWVRMSGVNTGTGVINSATGAVEGIVFEQLS